jgi:hypothetical protein
MQEIRKSELADWSIDTADAIEEVHRRRVKVTRKLADPDVSEAEAFGRYNHVLKGIREQLDSELNRYIGLPPEIREQREQHIGMIKDILNQRVSEFNASEMAVHLGRAISSFEDLFYGPIAVAEIKGAQAFAYLKPRKRGTLPTAVPSQITEKERTNKLIDDSVRMLTRYIGSLEADKDWQRKGTSGEDLSRDPIARTVFGKGEYDTQPIEVSQLLSTLREVYEPKLLLLNMNSGAIETVRARFDDAVEKLVKVQLAFDSRYKTRIVITKYPMMLQMIRDGFKPRDPLELLSGHPNATLSHNTIFEDKELRKTLLAQADLYINQKTTGRYCGQTVEYQLLGYVAFGDELEFYNIVLESLGRPRILAQAPKPVPDRRRYA